MNAAATEPLVGVINAGSSSVKSSFYEGERRILAGEVDGIGAHPSASATGPNGEAIPPPDLGATPPTAPSEVLPATHCQINLCRAKRVRSRMGDHPAATAFRHWFAASARKIRSVDRETRWRWRLKVLCTAACMLRKRWAERTDLKRCILRSRRRTT